MWRLKLSMPPAVENTSPGYAIKVRNEDFPGEIKESTDAVFLLLDLP